MDRPTNETALCQNSKLSEAKIQLLVSLETQLNMKEIFPLVSITLSLSLIVSAGRKTSGFILS